MLPIPNQVLTYAQQSKELANIEQDKLAKRIQEFRTQAEMDHLRASSHVGASTSSIFTNRVGMVSYKNIEAIMQSTAKGGVQTIKQGYLLKRSSSLRADWKRRFFVLDSSGSLYYQSHKGNMPAVSPSYHSTTTVEHNSRVFGRFRPRHQRSSSLGEENLSSRTVDLRTATIKIDAEDTDLRLCFRLISPSKTYTLQAENEADRIDWMDKITGVIASLLNSHLHQLLPRKNDVDYNNNAWNGHPLGNHESSPDYVTDNQADCVSMILREIPGNDLCAECSAPDPDWASLNLAILICIECSGAHRNLGVHVSKVRSITLDVKVWEPTVLDLFRTLGNTFCNSVWEELLLLQNDRLDGLDESCPTKKPSPNDAIHQKEKYIQAKYVDRLLVSKEAKASGLPSHATNIWEAVKTDNLRAVYRLIATSDVNVINVTYNEVVGAELNHDIGEYDALVKERDQAVCQRPDSCLQGCSLLHLACQYGNPVMLELLLQFGAKINSCDFHGRTPLHHCISKGNNQLAKFLLRRGACASIKDGGGLDALERAMEMGSITDEELFILLTECD